MNSITIVASASSRLLADIVLIRLRRAEIECRKISALFPIRSTPNAVGCWLPISSGPGIRLGDDTIACAGLLRQVPVRPADSIRGPVGLVELLTSTGVDTMGAHVLIEQLEQGHILICVHATNEAEASIVWHVFRHSGGEPIVVGGLPSPGAARGSDESRRVPPRVPVAA